MRMEALIGQVRVELTLFLRDKTVLFFSLFFPLVTVAFFGYLNREGSVGEVSYPSFLVAGGIGMVVVVSPADLDRVCKSLGAEAVVIGALQSRDGGEPVRHPPCRRHLLSVNKWRDLSDQLRYVQRLLLAHRRRQGAHNY